VLAVHYVFAAGLGFGLLLASGANVASVPTPVAPVGGVVAAVAGAGTNAAPSAGPVCTHGSAAALGELSCELAHGVGPLAAGVVVAAARPAAEAGEARSAAPELSTRIAASVARAIGGSARALPGALSLSEARKAAGDAKALVFVTPELAHGKLRLDAVAHPVALGFWDRLRVGATAPLAHATSQRRLDGELGAWLPRIALAATRIDRATATTDLAAVACGELGAPGTTEIVAVGRRKIQIGRVEGARFTVRVEASWPALSPVAPSPLREPIGAAYIVASERLAVGLTDRANGLFLSPALAPLSKLDAPLPWERVGCLSREGIGLGAPRACARGNAAAPDLAPTTEVDAFAGGAVVDKSGKPRTVVAFRDARTREVTLRDDAGHLAKVSGAGAALAIADLDLDGDPELVTSVDTDKPDADALVVSTWTRDGAVVERLRIPVKDGVRAVAACPLEGLHMAPLVAATESGLWVVR
jgi:hypothetical protein